MDLNPHGKIVRDEWNKTSQIRKNISLDEFVIMPNHFHGILIISDCRGTMHRAPTKELFGNPVSGSMPTIVRSFKSSVTRQINLSQPFNNPVWQRGYYEHIIRNENSLKKIRNYIINNPLKWALDEYNPEGNQ
jgi:REP element-mobilizing transposase RayT